MVVTIACNDGGEAFGGSRTRNLILMDCQMPVMDGFETPPARSAVVSRSLRRIGSQPVRIPIVALTANAMKR